MLCAVYTQFQVKRLKESRLIIRGTELGPCCLWEGLDKARPIVQTALLVRVQRFRNDLNKAVKRAEHKNKTNHPISSISHPTATANVSNEGGGYKTNGNILNSDKLCSGAPFLIRNANNFDKIPYNIWFTGVLHREVVIRETENVQKECLFLLYYHTIYILSNFLCWKIHTYY